MNGSAEIKKASKPFCSLAYLAKSTIAVNGSNDIKIVNGGSNGGQQVPAMAKVQDRSNGSTPTPSPTFKLNGHNIHNNNNNRKEQKNYNNNNNNYNNINNGHDNNNNNNNNKDDNNNQKNKLNSLDYEDDVFGIINEEDQLDSCDSGDLRRPWEFSNTYVKRVPPALMTNGLNGHQSTAHYFHNGHNNLNGGVGSSGLTSLSKLNSLDCWDYTIELECLKGPEDLQLAAELGKTLLERNKELETQLKEYKNLIEEKDQEIVYLKKHSAALREVNESRLKVYEQLEVGVQELERANHRLVVENNNCKKQIKAFVQNGESLENRCEELTKQLEDVRQSLTAERRKNERLAQERNSLGAEAARAKSLTEQHLNASNLGVDANHLSVSANSSFACQSPNGARNSTGISSQSGNEEQLLDMSIVGGASGIPGLEGEENEEIMKIVNDLESTKKAYMAEQQRCAELEEQLLAIIQENQTLQTRIVQSSTNEEMRSMQEELSILDEVRQGQMCSRCLRAVDDRATLNDEQSSLAPTEEVAEEDYDERSLLDMEGSTAEGADVSESNELNKSAYRSSVSIKMSNRAAVSLDLNANGNPYRDLVEKYEALLEVQRSSLVRKTSSLNQSTNVPENATHATGNNDGPSSCTGSTTNEQNTNTTVTNTSAKNNGQRGRTPCEFSEAETSSSGFSDETSNKSTQTDDRPGYFLCSIGDGEDCKFSIYDDVSPIDSRFRNRPEYRELFKEIFAVLKKAAENKEEGDKLPLLDDTHPAVVTTAKVPPVTPANEELPMEFGDDSQSIISSAVSEQSFAMSECVTKLERKTAKKHIIEKNQENKPPLVELEASLSQLAMTSGVSTEDPNKLPILENGRILTPLKREPLEYLMVGVGVKKKGRNRKNRNFSNDRSESPVALPSPPRFYVGSGKKRRPLNVSQSPGSPAGSGAQTPVRGNQGAKFEWNGSSMVIYNRGISAAHRARDFDVSGIEYRPSTVSQDLHKLKKLDLSYAEVLRRADSCKHHSQHNYHTPTPQNRRRNNRH